MKILITGSNGFVGTALIKKLLSSDGYRLYGIDIKKSNIKHKNLINIQADLGKPDWIKQLPGDIDKIIYLAQSRYYRDFPDGADDMFNINIRSFFHLLEWSRSSQVDRVLLASSGSVYEKKDRLLKESDHCRPDSFYAATKWCAENLVQPYSQFFDVVIMRFFTIYGPGQKDMLIPNIIKKIKNKKEIKLAKETGIYLTPIFIDDCVEIVSKLVEKDTLNKIEIINVAGNSIVSLADIISYVEKYLGIKANISVQEKNPSYLAGSNEKMVNLLNLKPKIDFSNGIRRVIEHL